MSAIRHVGLREMYFSLMQDAILEATEKWQRQFAGYKKGEQLRWKEFLEDLEGSNRRIYKRAEDGISNPYTASLASTKAFEDFINAIHPYLEPATESRLVQYVNKRFLDAETEWRESAKKITPINKIIEELEADITLKELENSSTHLLDVASEAMWLHYVANNYDDVRRIGDAVVVGLLELAKATGRPELFPIHSDSMTIMSMLVSSNSKALPDIVGTLTSPQFSGQTLITIVRILFASLTDTISSGANRTSEQLRVDERNLQIWYRVLSKDNVYRWQHSNFPELLGYDHSLIILLEGMRYRTARIRENEEARNIFSETWRELQREYAHLPQQDRFELEVSPTIQLLNERQFILSEATPTNPLQVATLETAIARSYIDIPQRASVDEAAQWLVSAHNTLDGLDHALAEEEFYSTLAGYMRATGHTRAEIRAAEIARDLVRQSGDKRRADEMRRVEEARLTEPDPLPVRPTSTAHDELMDLLLPPAKEKGPPKPRKTKLEPPKPKQ